MSPYACYDNTVCGNIAKHNNCSYNGYLISSAIIPCFFAQGFGPQSPEFFNHKKAHSSPRLGRNYTRDGLWPALVCYLMAGSRGVEPHPVSENLVFKASRRTNPAALLPKDTTLMHLVYRFVKRTTTIALGFILVRFQLWPRLRAWFAWLVAAWPLLLNPSKCLCCATLN